MPSHDRTYDLVLFGGTGFTGGLTAEELARRAPAGTRWALAGRNPAKLEELRTRLTAIEPRCADLDLLTADVGDPASLRAVAEAAKVVVTTVGPYIRHGEPLVAACAEAGTDYADLTGEPEFVDRMYVAHHASAEASGARIVHCCGFDSIPHDLGAQFTVEQLPGGEPIKVEGFVRAAGMVSAGTFHSAVEGFSRPRENLGAAKARKAVEPRPEGRRVHGIRRGPHREPAIGAWAVPLPTIDPQVVLRSAKALDAYGPDFSYGHYAWVKRAAVIAGAGAGLTTLFAAAQVPPLKKLILGRMSSGQGPSEARREKGWFVVRFVGEGGGRRVVTEVGGREPGYTETAVMLAQAGLCLALDELPAVAGQVTTAQAMGPVLRERLIAAGLTFEVLETS